MPRARALVVYSRVGGGHFSAARALAAALGATGCVDARLVDVYLECGRFPVTLFPKAYAWLARGHPAAWRAVYRGSELPPTDPGLILGPFLRPGLRALTRGYRPDLIVSVLPVVNGLLAESARAVGARMEVVLTDWHAVHPFWVGRGVDQYTAPTESSRSDCVKFGAAPNAVCVEGIPVRREFTAEARTSSAAARPRILVMVGAEGSPRALGNVAYLARAGLTAEMVVVCGRDGELRRKVQALPSAMPIRTLGYVEDVADLMRSADLLVTKAGGVSLAEAFCCRVPVVIHDVLPGQEAGNLEYVLPRGAVAYARCPSDLAGIVRRLASDAALREELAARGYALARPHASARIAWAMVARLGLDAAGA